MRGVSIPGKEDFNVSGEPSTIPEDTHIPIGKSSPEDISEIIGEILGDL
jgi:hypothetical protein